jgi:hypothetical protein
VKRRSSTNRLRFFGLDTTSEATTITQESTPVRIEQLFGYDPPRIFLEVGKVWFCSVCDIVSSRIRSVAEITGGPDWSAEPDWRLSTRLSLAADFTRRTAKRFDLIFRTDERVEISGNHRPTRLVLVGTAQLPLSLVPPVTPQTFLLSFSFTDGEATEIPFGFTVQKLLFLARTGLAKKAL